MATKRKLLTVDDIHGAWAILPTPAKDNASDWRADDTVDVDETVRMVEGLIDSGVDGIMALGTLGECATLNWGEKKKFLGAAIETVRGRVPFFTGATSLGTRDTIWQSRQAFDMGADGTMVGLPMWCPADVPTAVEFFRNIAEALPEMAICVYANPQAFHFSFPPEFWAQVSEIPQVVTAKYVDFGRLYTDIKASRKRIRFLPIDIGYYAASRLDPEFMNAFWSSSATCGPDVIIRFRDEMLRAKQTNDWTKVEKLSDAITAATMNMIPKGSGSGGTNPFELFGMYNIGLEKEKMNAAGWMKAGPFRPPHHIVPEAYLEGARKAGRMWAELDKKLKAEK